MIIVLDYLYIKQYNDSKASVKINSFWKWVQLLFLISNNDTTFLIMTMQNFNWYLSENVLVMRKHNVFDWYQVREGSVNLR